MRVVTALAILALASPAVAQVPLTVRIRVTDSTRGPLENVSVSVMSGFKVALASGTTDRTGARTLRLDARPDEFEVVARRVGYLPANKFFAREKRDTITVELTLKRLTPQLEAVRVTAAQSLAKQKLSVDAEAIEAFERPLIDATDIISKMRPDMVYGLGGDKVCAPAAYVWVNGVRIEDPPVNAIMEAKHNAGAQFSNSSVLVNRATSNAPPAPQTAAAGPGALRQSPHSVYTQLGTSVLSVLGSIKPEHIASIEMHDCKDFSIDKKGGSPAIFVILKDGVTYEPGIGSRVGTTESSDKLLKRIMLPQKVAVAPPPPTAAAEPTPLEAFRMRVLGVFNEDTGAPVDSAEVVDIATGLFARTTETGTVPLAFLPLGDSRIAIRKAGFKTDTLQVRISPADTIAITVLLRSGGH